MKKLILDELDEFVKVTREHSKDTIRLLIAPGRIHQGRQVRQRTFLSFHTCLEQPVCQIESG